MGSVEKNGEVNKPTVFLEKKTPNA